MPGTTTFDLDAITHKVQHTLAAQTAADPTISHDPEAIARLVRAEAGGILSDGDVLAVLRKLRHDSVGVGQLEQVMAIQNVTDILVNGAGTVWYDRGNGLEQSVVRFDSEQQVRQLATRLITAAGSRIDEAQCFANGYLLRPDGTTVRVHAILSPPAQAGTCISLRVLRHADARLETLIAKRGINSETAANLSQLVSARRSFIVVGGTGSGKTTMLTALLGEVAAKERIICIEDTAELRPQHPHVLNLISRGANTEGNGAVTMADLLRQALRMRPDRIVVGEIRGVEVIDLLAALNTGHDGCAGTIHANSITEVPARLEALAAQGGMSRDALMSQLAAASPVILAMKRFADGRRRLNQIGVLKGFPTTVDILWDASESSAPHIDWGRCR
ncbi:MAG: TadA family conjugal transfer-associated ATPase [Corynebacterium sp.]|uniref:TadA family conjugal transfer-associated ATPase n=1 Tax=Corynebacterium sp. TaxID=1720 RepID=UPI0026DCED12|nr:TadA family conjugal transfer-associated ATPase [Corynebacterium sp.]MDO5099081.1 TadA family conjugal transfer-associated ATPase [Corynebacterium sp.]